MMARQFLISAMIASVFATSALSTSFGPKMYTESTVSYDSYLPIDEDMDTGDGTSLQLYTEIGTRLFAAFSTGISVNHDQGNTFVASHIGYNFGNQTLAFIAGNIYGDVPANFYGLEGRANYKALTLDLRLTDWDIDGFGDSYRVDVDASYQINEKWSAFYDYTHYKLDDGDINFDDYLVGVSYQALPSMSVQLGVGEYHPIRESTGYDQVSRKIHIGLSYNLGDERNTPKLDIPNLSQF